jgi:hypothetical protein
MAVGIEASWGWNRYVVIAHITYSNFVGSVNIVDAAALRR